MKMLCNASDLGCVPMIATPAFRIVQTGCVFDFFQCRSLIAERLVLVGENRQRSGTMPRCILKETHRKALGFVDHDVLRALSLTFHHDAAGLIGEVGCGIGLVGTLARPNNQ